MLTMLRDACHCHCRCPSTQTYYVYTHNMVASNVPLCVGENVSEEGRGRVGEETK